MGVCLCDLRVSGSEAAGLQDAAIVCCQSDREPGGHRRRPRPQVHLSCASPSVLFSSPVSPENAQCPQPAPAHGDTPTCHWCVVTRGLKLTCGPCWGQH